MSIISAQYGRHYGLGNKLFPWSRAKILSRQYKIPMVTPLWFSPHGGGITRGGVDYARALRKVWLFRNFCRSQNEISLIKYLLKYERVPLCKCTRLSEAEQILRNSSSDIHIRFAILGQNETGHDFVDFKNESSFLRGELFEATLPSQKTFINNYLNLDFIGLNVRCGNDFVSRESGEKGFVKTSLQWFIYALKRIRQDYGKMPAIVVSDGGLSQLAPLLREDDVSLLNSPTAIADLLVLTHAKVLLGSGNSSFSAWASFLGEMDTFTSKDTPFLHNNGLSYGRDGKKILEVI